MFIARFVSDILITHFFVFVFFFFVAPISAWIEDKYIKNYAEYKDELVKSSKSAAFKEAVQKIDEFISDPIVSLFPLL